MTNYTITRTGESDEIGGASDETSRKDHRQTRVATSESVTRETGIEDYQTQASLARGAGLTFESFAVSENWEQPCSDRRTEPWGSVRLFELPLSMPRIDIVVVSESEAVQ
jgi:hypothetical protein